MVVLEGWNEMLGVFSPQKTDIFTFDNNMLYSHVKRSLLLWAHDTLSFAAKIELIMQVKWFGKSLDSVY